MDCYACGQEATRRCNRCGNAYCGDHGDQATGGQGLCAACLDPASAAPSGTVFRLSVFALLFASVLALWLLVRPPSLPGESSGVIQPPPTSDEETPGGTGPTASPGARPTASPTPSASATPSPTASPEPTPAAPGQYTVVEGDTWYDIADAFGIDAEALAAANGRTLDDLLQIGEVLVIPQQ